jgi:hypothetical protein
MKGRVELWGPGMIVSHKHKFIFLKTRKTAGTSVELALSTICGPEDIITPITEDGNGMRQGRQPQNYLHARATWPLRDRIRWALRQGELKLKNRPDLGFFGHVTAAVARERLGLVVWNSYYKFSIERNPWDRQVSHYYWRYRREKENRPSFQSFIQSCQPLQNWEIYAIGDDVVVDRVIRYDSLDTEFASVLAELGLDSVPALPRAKSSYRTSRVPYRDLFDETSRAIVAGWFQREIDHFGWTF